MADIFDLSEADLLKMLLLMFITQQDVDDYAAGVSLIGRLRTVNDINTV